MRIGEQELDLLKFLQDKGGSSAKTVLSEFGEPRGLARTTIHTMLDRLTKKGFVEKDVYESGITYTAIKNKQDTLNSAIENFVKSTLDDSIQPLATYLADGRTITAEELEILKRLVKELEEKRP
jgi:predicted transcriptional regulator